GNIVEGLQIADLVARDRDQYRACFRGADAVVHFGFVGNSNPTAGNSTEDRFWNELANVEMAYNLYQTCLEENVRRVVVASSNHAADFYEPLILDNVLDVVDPNGRALSDNYYGWAKATYEHLGFVFAAGKQARSAAAFSTGEQPAQGRQLENVQLRIGGPRESDVADCKAGDLRCVRRALAVYISDRDLQQLVIKSIETADIRNEHGVPFQIFYGISGNSHAFWSLANARKVIGYTPQDNSEWRFQSLLAEHMAAAQTA
ncbi:MAG: NAD-dependent epimerase/dehydratase family protein, partial [Chloroflexota bacterium]|nr:NAD-dependent epimerase/dehydratase family protein [Chloroflexota bacterium]